MNDYWNDLKNVTTLAQALRDYRVSKTALIYAIDTGRVVGIRCGKAVLISTRSIDANYPKRKNGL